MVYAVSLAGPRISPDPLPVSLVHSQSQVQGECNHIHPQLPLLLRMVLFIFMQLSFAFPLTVYQAFSFPYQPCDMSRGSTVTLCASDTELSLSKGSGLTLSNAGSSEYVLSTCVSAAQGAGPQLIQPCCLPRAPDRWNPSSICLLPSHLSSSSQSSPPQRSRNSLVFMPPILSRSDL